jgi:hypothetical protein
MKSIPKRTTHPKAKHNMESHPLSIKNDPKRNILLKVKLNMVPHPLSIKNDNLSMWTTHTFPTPTATASDIHNKMGDAISHMTMMVIVPFSMIKMDANTMTTIAAMFNMSFTIQMTTIGR